MARKSNERDGLTASWRARIDTTALMAILALGLSGFFDLHGTPPGDLQQSSKKAPFVWADEHY